MRRDSPPHLYKHVSLNLTVRGIGKSATLAINERSRDMEKAGKPVFKFGLGQSPFPVPQPVVDALKARAHEKDYLQVEGLQALREAVAGFHRRWDSVQVKPSNILVGPGSKELMFILQLVFYGEIILPTPCWVSYIPQARILGRNVRPIHTTFESNWHITPEQLAGLCEEQKDIYRPRLLVLNYPTNPDGGTMGPEELKGLARVARKYEVVVLSDEIYGQLHHQGKHVSIAKYYPERTIISSGLSKWCGAGGWRLGTFAFPPDLRWLLESMAAVASETYTSVCAPVQYAAVTAFRPNAKIESYLFHTRRILAALGGYCHKVLSSSGVRVHPPEGAFYLFFDASPLAEGLKKRGVADGAGMARALLDDTGVAVLPGSVFGRPPEELTARLAYVNFDGAKALAASEAVPPDSPLPEEFIRTWCGPTVEAVTRLADWLGK